jgi:hypothetical protein
LPHPAALEPAVDAELHAADAQPLVAFVGFTFSAATAARIVSPLSALTRINWLHADGEQAAPLHLLEETVLLDRCAG